MKKGLAVIIAGLLCLAFVGYLVKQKTSEKEAAQPKTAISEPKEAETSETRASGPKEIPGIMASLPETAEFVLRLGSLSSLFRHLSVTENSVFGQPVEEIEDIKSKIGFNPLLISDLQASGFDTEKEFGIMIEDIRFPESKPENAEALKDEAAPTSHLLLFLPLTDAGKATETIRAALTAPPKEENDAALAMTQDGPFTVFSSDKHTEKIYLFEKEDYLFVGMSSASTDAKALMESVAAGASHLSEAENFRNVANSLSHEEEVFAYFDIKKFFEKNLDALKNYSKEQKGPGKPDFAKLAEKYLGSYKGGGISADLDAADLVVNTALHAEPGSKPLKMMEGIRFDKKIVLGIQEKPALLLSTGINWSEYHKAILETMSEADRAEMEARLEKIRTEAGIDIKKDLIENAAGNLNLGIYDGASISAMNYNALLTLSVKDEAKAESLIEKLVALLPPAQKAGVVKMMVGETKAHVIPVFGFVQLYVGVKDGNLILSVGKPMFEKAVRADPASGFVSALEDKELAETLKADGSSFYLDLGEVFKALRNFSALMPKFSPGQPEYEKIAAFANQIKYLLSHSEMKGDALYGQLKVKTNFSEPFLTGLQKHIKGLENIMGEK